PQAETSVRSLQRTVEVGGIDERQLAERGARGRIDDLLHPALACAKPLAVDVKFQLGIGSRHVGSGLPRVGPSSIPAAPDCGRCLTGSRPVRMGSWSLCATRGVALLAREGKRSRACAKGHIPLGAGHDASSSIEPSRLPWRKSPWLFPIIETIHVLA